MKKLLITLGLIVPLSWVAAAPEPLTVAILDFATPSKQKPSEGFLQSGSSVEDTLGAETAVLLNALLSSSSDLILVERGELAKVLSEQEWGLSGTVNPETAAHVGYLTGAKVLITGRLFEAGGKNYAVARIISTETSRVYGETVSYADKGAFDSACKELAGKIQNLISKRGDTLVAKVEDPKELTTRLEKLVKGKKLPSVAINIPESHLTRSIPDPAVETELRLIFAQLGFHVIDTKESAETPDIKIKGEAFSEFAARKGNLVSCRARVEVQVHRTSDQALLLSDREAGVGVDLSENVAAKEALAFTARKLADRIVAKLVPN